MKTNNKTEKQMLDIFFDFVNADIRSLEESDFMGLILHYSRLLTHSKIKHSSLNVLALYNKYTNDLLLEMSSPDLFSERKNIFFQIQSNIKSKLQKILDALNSETPEVTAPLLEMQGKRKISIDPNTKEFIDSFRPVEFKADNKLDLNCEMALVELVFFDMVQDYKLQANRFKKCLKCHKFFYQTTEKKKEYCGKRCSSAARQTKHYHQVIKPEREKGGKGKSKSKAKG